jgi:hypothetical protein
MPIPPITACERVNISVHSAKQARGESQIVLFRPGLAQKPRLWPGLEGLWLLKTLGQARAPNHGLALAWLGPGPGLEV